MPTAFVFAGGGSLGAIQAGALGELIRAGERPDFVVGASVGALNACFFACRPNLKRVEQLQEIWRGLHRRDIFPFSFNGMIDTLRGHPGLFRNQRLADLVRRHLDFERLEEADLPVHVVATNQDGATICLSKGAAVDAVLASAAIPVAFPPVQIGRDRLIDGAIAGNTPILTALELGATRIIVLQTGYACELNDPPRSAVAHGLHALTLLISNQLERDLKLVAGRAVVLVTPHLCPLAVSPFDFSQGAELIERSAALTRDWIENGGLRSSAPEDAFDHHHEAMMAGRPAIGGFDPVSFFEGDGEPALGSTEFETRHDGTIYRFASADRLAKFKADPDAYLPQYGGSCAFAMSRGKLVRGDPHFHEVRGGKLYFNLNGRVHKAWRSKADRLIEKADAKWKL